MGGNPNTRKSGVIRSAVILISFFLKDRQDFPALQWLRLCPSNVGNEVWISWSGSQDPTRLAAKIPKPKPGAILQQIQLTLKWFTLKKNLKKKSG